MTPYNLIKVLQGPDVINYFDGEYFSVDRGWPLSRLLINGKLLSDVDIWVWKWAFPYSCCIIIACIVTCLTFQATLHYGGYANLFHKEMHGHFRESGGSQAHSLDRTGRRLWKHPPLLHSRLCWFPWFSLGHIHGEFSGQLLSRHDLLLVTGKGAISRDSGLLVCRPLRWLHYHVNIQPGHYWTPHNWEVRGCAVKHGP